MRYSHLGVQFTLTVGLLFLAGYWADGKLGTAPLLGLLGVMAGFALGFYHLYQGVFGRSGVEQERGNGGDSPGG